MYKRGEIVMIPVPFSNLRAHKKRPVVVISNNEYNESHPDMIVMGITSNLTQQGIRITNDCLASGKLPKPSLIRPDKVYTLFQDLVLNSVGQIQNDILTNATSELIGFVSLVDN